MLKALVSFGESAVTAREDVIEVDRAGARGWRKRPGGCATALGLLTASNRAPTVLEPVVGEAVLCATNWRTRFGQPATPTPPTAPRTVDFGDLDVVGSEPVFCLLGGLPGAVLAVEVGGRVVDAGVPPETRCGPTAPEPAGEAEPCGARRAAVGGAGRPSRAGADTDAGHLSR